MAFKYSAISDTVRRLGYDVLETPKAVLELQKLQNQQAIKAAGYDAVDIPGDPHKIISTR